MEQRGSIKAGSYLYQGNKCTLTVNCGVFRKKKMKNKKVAASFYLKTSYFCFADSDNIKKAYAKHLIKITVSSESNESVSVKTKPTFSFSI